jgi:hypothetical protein
MLRAGNEQVGERSQLWWQVERAVLREVQVLHLIEEHLDPTLRMVFDGSDFGTPTLTSRSLPAPLASPESSSFLALP